MATDQQSRKWLLTINNPDTGGYSHEYIRDIISNHFPSIIYYCMADEQGQTLHTHLYMIFSGGVRFSTIKKHFDTAHIEAARGSSRENRDYVEKTGKWKNDSEKQETIIEDTFEEWGEIPLDHRNIRSEYSAVIDRLQNGATNAEILAEFPHFMRGLRDIDYVRQTLKADENRDKWRSLCVTYIWGQTATGKTRYVMDQYGYSNVYAVNNYKHPFDGYMGESVMLFDEYCSGVRIQDMNNYLDGYPIALPARYSNKQACYDRVYIISNLDIRAQYKQEQQMQPEVWAAFLRRIHQVMHFMPDGSHREYTTLEYMSGADDWEVANPEEQKTIDDIFKTKEK